MAKQAKVTVSRSAVTGRFVKSSYAKAHPNTTVNQHIKKGK